VPGKSKHRDRARKGIDDVRHDVVGQRTLVNDGKVREHDHAAVNAAIGISAERLYQHAHAARRRPLVIEKAMPLSRSRRTASTAAW